MAVATNNATRTTSNIIAKDELRARAVSVARVLCQQVKQNRGVSNELKQSRMTEFMKLLPLTIEIAGLAPAAPNSLYTPDQMEARTRGGSFMESEGGAANRANERRTLST